MSAALSAERRRAMLRTAMGPVIAGAMADPLVLEIMVNPDGALRLDRLGEGRVDTGVAIDVAQTERIIRLVASHARTEVHAGQPIVSAELPPHIDGGAGERFEGVLPPVATGPCFFDPQARPASPYARRLCRRWHHGLRYGGQFARGGHAALQYPRRRRHELGQDDARQCAARRDGMGRYPCHPD